MTLTKDRLNEMETIFKYAIEEDLIEDPYFYKEIGTSLIAAVRELQKELQLEVKSHNSDIVRMQTRNRELRSLLKRGGEMLELLFEQVHPTAKGDKTMNQLKVDIKQALGDAK